jgi:hypothetical protein
LFWLRTSLAVPDPRLSVLRHAAPGVTLTFSDLRPDASRRILQSKARKRRCPVPSPDPYPTRPRFREEKAEVLKQSRRNKLFQNKTLRVRRLC